VAKDELEPTSTTSTDINLDEAPKDVLSVDAKTLPVFLRWPVFLLGLAIAALAFRVSGFGVFEETILRPSTVIAGLVTIILSRPLFLNKNNWHFKKASILFNLLLIPLLGYIIYLALDSSFNVSNLPLDFGKIQNLARFGLVIAAAIGIIYFVIHSISLFTRPKWLTNRNWFSKVPFLLLDVAILATFGVALKWYFTIFRKLERGSFFFVSPTENFIALAAVICILIVALRLFGPPLTIVGSLALAYGLVGQNTPGMLRHAGYSFTEVMRVLWYSFDGVFTQPAAVVISLILIFIVFGTVLEGIGAGAVLLKLAFNLTGGLRGGAAHAAIVASGLFGTISGSVTANVVGTGVFTIPMIKGQGFKNPFAGGVEAAASSGGQIMPPVMGAVAFIMADVTGIPYLNIALGALIPALFYYGGLFAAVTVEAAKHDIPVIPKEQRPKITRQDWLMSLCFLIPMIIIIWVLIAGYSAALAGFYATITAIVLGILLNPEFRTAPWKIIPILSKAGQACSVILCAVALIGIVIGIFNMTGLGLRFSSFILDIAGSNLLLALFLMMGGCLILGMGVPTVPAYLIIVLVMGPAIQGMGEGNLSIFTVHLFAVYYAVLSFVTPPVAIAAIVAAPIAEAPPMKTAVAAIKIAFVGFLVPYMFVFNPSLTLIGGVFEWGEFISAVVRMILAIWLIETALAGFSRASLNPVVRILRIVAGIALIFVSPTIHWAAFIIGILLLLWEFLQVRSSKSLTTKTL